MVTPVLNVPEFNESIIASDNDPALIRPALLTVSLPVHSREINGVLEMLFTEDFEHNYRIGYVEPPRRIRKNAGRRKLGIEEPHHQYAAYLPWAWTKKRVKSLSLLDEGYFARYE